MVRRVLIVSSTAFVVAACSLFADLDGFDGETPVAGTDASVDAGSDANIEGAAVADAFVTPDAAPDACPMPNISAGLLAWYPLDENGGTTITDCSGNGLHGVSVGTAPAWSDGHSPASGRALDLDGDRCFSIGDAPSLAFATSSRFTLTVWLRPKSFATSGADARLIFGRRGSGTGWHVATDDPSDVELEVGTTNAFEVQTGITSSAWVHVAFVYDGARKIYVGGILVKTSTATVDFAAAASAATRLGCNSSGVGYVGLIDDLRIYGRALSNAEITTLAQP